VEPIRYRLNPNGGTHALLVRLVPSGSRVLDVGCAGGYLGELLSAKGCSLVGVDVDGDSVARARSSGAYREVHRLDIDSESLPFEPQTFDVVLCAVVLEHLRDPHGALCRLCGLISDGGSIVVSLPNVAHFSIRFQLLLGRFRYSESGILDRTHLHLFTYESAIRLLTSANLAVRRVLAGSNRFGNWLSFGPSPIRRLRGLLAFNIVIVATPR